MLFYRHTPFFYTARTETTYRKKNLFHNSQCTVLSSWVIIIARGAETSLFKICATVSAGGPRGMEGEEAGKEA